MERNWMELLAQAPEALADEASALLIEAGASAVERREGAAGAVFLVTHFEMRAGAAARMRAAEAALADLGIPPGAIAVRLIEDEDWVSRSRGAFPPQAHGERLWLRPPWSDEAPPPGRAEIVLEPGRAFGTGRHPTTRLCREALDRLCADSPPARFLDLGCGSGILSAAVLKLGAGRALALDLDPDAVESARELARRNGLADRLTAAGGTLEPAALGDWWGRVDLLAANIFLGPLRALAPRMAEALAPGGRGVLSGIGYEQADALAEAAAAAGLAVRARLRLEEWAALEISRG